MSFAKAVRVQSHGVKGDYGAAGQAHGSEAASAACGAGLEAAAGAQKERDLCGLDGQVSSFWLSSIKGCTCTSPLTLLGITGAAFILIAAPDSRIWLTKLDV